MSIRNKPLAVIDFIEAGMGHIVTAQAISDALREKYGDLFEIVDKYTLRDSKFPCLPKYERFLVNQVKMHSAIPGYSKLQMTAMHIGGVKNSLRIVHSGVYRKETAAVIEEFRALDPDLIVFTHYFTLYAGIEYRNKYKPSCKIVLYCPDNNVHGWWDNRVDRLYTNNPLATADALHYKFPKENICEVFYPTRKAVSESNESKEYYREKFGIPQDKFAVVIADGVYAKAKTKKVTYELLKSDIPLTVCPIAGKNEELYKELCELKDKVKPNITLIPFGFVKDAPQLYGACDLFITKSGPNAILDSVMMGTPIIADYYGSPIEKATKRLFIDTKKCGYYIKNTKDIRSKVDELSRDGEQMDTLRENLKFFDKRINGAEQIADDLVKLMGLGVWAQV
ncbi:MAG: glycosyltransferase [Clostridia bacterium]|nr:glycosyltransferase [Clostridia bacterium]